MRSGKALGTIAIPFLLISPLFSQTPEREVATLSKSKTRVMIAATDIGTGGMGFHPLGNPRKSDFVIGAGIFSAKDFVDRTIDGAVYSQRGILMPVRFGLRSEILSDQLSSLEWVLYWVGSLGPVFALGYPQGLPFQQTVSHFNAGLGGELYSAMGLEASFGSSAAIYLEAGAYALKAFASRSLFRRAIYFGPSVALGLRTGF
jgi:hypothetical protein